MSDCPFTGKTLLEMRELPPLSPPLCKIEERCNFDLCSDCVKQNNEAGTKNVCSKGHQLYRTVTTESQRWYWYCDKCGRKAGRNLDPDVLAWRCEYDYRSISLKTEVRAESVDEDDGRSHGDTILSRGQSPHPTLLHFPAPS